MVTRRHTQPQKHSRLMIALLDAKRGLRRFRDTGEYDERIDLLESALEDAPNSRSGMLPPLKQESDVNTDVDNLIDDIENLRTECSEINKDDPSQRRIDNMEELIDELRDGIREI